MASWTAPRTWTVGEIVTAALLNTHVRDNELYLKAGDSGIIQFEERVGFDNDASFYAEISSSNPTILMDTGDYLQYVRASNYLQAVIGGTTLELLMPQYVTLRGVGPAGPQSTPGTTWVEIDGCRFLFDKAEVGWENVDIGFEWQIVSRAGGASTCQLRIYDVTNATDIVTDSHATEDDPVLSPFATITASGSVEYRLEGTTDAVTTGTYNAGAVNILLRTHS
jgi:hypothetical protein